MRRQFRWGVRCAVGALGLAAAASLAAAPALPSPEDAFAAARSAFAGGREGEGAWNLRCALDLAPPGGGVWSAALVEALQRARREAAGALDGRTGALLPWATLADDPLDEAEATLLAIPERFEDQSFLPKALGADAAGYLAGGDWKRAADLLERYLDEHPKNLKLLVLLGRIYEEQGRLDYAAERYEAALRQATLDEDLLALHGSAVRLLVKEGRLFDAEQRVRTLVDLARARLVAFRGRADVGVRDRLARERLLELEERLGAALNLFGVIKVLKGQLGEAQELLEAARAECPGRLTVALNLARTLRLRGQRETAVASLQLLHAAAVTARDELAQLAQGALGLGGGGSLGRLREAEAEVQRLAARLALRVARVLLDSRSEAAAQVWVEDAVSRVPDDPLPWLLMGRLHEARGERPPAELAYRKALARAADRPAVAQASRERVEALFTEEAREILRRKTRSERVAEAALDLLDPKALAGLQKELLAGRAELTAGRFREAFALFRSLARRWPRCAEAPYYRGLAALMLGSQVRAAEGFLDALDVDPSHALAQSHLAYLKMERGVDLARALELSEAAWKARPDEPVVQLNHAWILFRLGERRQAYELLGKALAKSPREPLFHYRVGLMYFRDGLYDVAHAKFVEVLGLLPDYPRALMMAGLCQARLGRIPEGLAYLSRSLDGLRERSGSVAVIRDTVRALTASLGGSPAKGAQGLSVVTVEEARRNALARELEASAVQSMARGELGRARGLLAQGAASHPRDANLAIDQAFLEILDGQPEAARAGLDRVLDFNTAEFRAYSGYAHVVFRRGELLRFATYVERLRDVPPTLAYAELLDAVMRRWRDVLTADPDDAEALYQYGRCQVLAGDAEGALTTLERARGRELELWRAEAALRLFVLTKADDRYRKARAWLGAVNYGHGRELAELFGSVTAPALTAPEEEKPFREPLSSDDGWSEQARAGRERLGDPLALDVRGTGLLRRRWDGVEGHLKVKWAREREERDREDEVAAAAAAGPALVGPGTLSTTGAPGAAGACLPDSQPSSTLLVPSDGGWARLAAAAAAAAGVSPEQLAAAARLTGTHLAPPSAPPTALTTVPSAPRAPSRFLPLDPSTGASAAGEAGALRLSKALDLARRGLVAQARAALAALAAETPGWVEPAVDVLVLDVLLGDDAGAQRWLEGHRTPLARLGLAQRARALGRLRAGGVVAPGALAASFASGGQTELMASLAQVWDQVLAEDRNDVDANVQRALLAWLAGDRAALARCRANLRGASGDVLLKRLEAACTNG